jgi:hypothetical protein
MVQSLNLLPVQSLNLLPCQSLNLLPVHSEPKHQLTLSAISGAS